MYYSTTKLEFQMMYAVKIEVLTFFRQNSAGQDDIYQDKRVGISNEIFM